MNRRRKGKEISERKGKEISERKGKEKCEDDYSKVELPISLSPSKNFDNKRHAFDSFKKKPSKKERELGLKIGWDFENARIPYKEALNLKEKVSTAVQKLRKGYFITHFFGYGSRETFTPEVFADLQLAGIHIVYTEDIKTVSSNNLALRVRDTDIGDYKIIEEMLIHALDFRPPGNLLFITKDQDFSRPMGELKQRGFVVLVAYLGELSPIMKESSSAGWDWKYLYKGLEEAFINRKEGEQDFEDTVECEDLFENTGYY